MYPTGIELIEQVEYPNGAVSAKNILHVSCMGFHTLECHYPCHVKRPIAFTLNNIRSVRETDR